MRIITITLLLMFANIASANSFTTLEDFNRLPPWDGTSTELSGDPELVARFQSKKFVCQEAVDLSPKESDVAARAFSAVVEYVSAGDKVENFWQDSAHRQMRETLLLAALKAGSWKAEYLDTVLTLWSTRRPADSEAQKAAAKRLGALAQKGVPIAAYKYARRLFPYYITDMYEVDNYAIDTGSPHAMEAVGEKIILKSKELRPLAKALLECAASRGYGQAYKGLGVLASMDGRWLDAYRFWEKGVNEGCLDCINYVDQIGRVRASSSGASTEDRSLYLESAPDLIAIKKFHSDNFFYELSELSDFKRSLPSDKYFRPNDADVLQLLKLQNYLRTQ